MKKGKTKTKVKKVKSYKRDVPYVSDLFSPGHTSHVFDGPPMSGDTGYADLGHSCYNNTGGYRF